MQEALRAWGEATLSLALDTTMRWGQYCMLQRGQLTGNARFVNEVKAILGGISSTASQSGHGRSRRNK